MLLDGYVRVSQVGAREGERFISPSVQREQIEGWAAAHRAVIGEVFEELDESGARGDRPLLNEAIERIERGESAGLIVAKLDRFGRSVIDGLRSIQRIEQAGGTFVSVQDGFDIGTSTGRLVLQILFSIGEWELERVRANWDIARGRAIKRGAYVGRPPFGYRRRKDGRLEVQSAEAAIVREIYERRGDDQSCAAIAEAINTAGAKTRIGHPFTANSVYATLKNPAYRGEARHGGHSNPNAHEAIVDRAFWQRCQHVPRPRSRSVRSLLGGLARCGSCGRMMSSDWPVGTRSRFHVYRCSNQGICPAPAYARGDELDPLVEEFVFRRCLESPSPDAAQAVEECEAAIVVAENHLVDFRDEPSMLETLGPSSFAAGLSSRKLRLEKSLVDLARARRELGAPVDITKLAEDWEGLDWKERGTQVGRVLDCVLVARGDEPLQKRTRVFRLGKGPIGPVGGKLSIGSGALSKGGERLVGHRRWPVKRLEAELRELLAGGEEWPSYNEFAAAGKARLFAQALRWGGPYYWGHRLGVRVPGRPVRWNREVVRDALAPFLKGRDSWPRAKEFTDAGMKRVYEAAKYYGGLRYWGEQFGIEYGKVRMTAWPKERVANELRKFTRGRADWPRKSEFFEADLRQLYDAMTREGGSAYWAEQLGLTIQLPPQYRRGPRQA